MALTKVVTEDKIEIVGVQKTIQVREDFYEGNGKQIQHVLFHLHRKKF